MDNQTYIFLLTLGLLAVEVYWEVTNPHSMADKFRNYLKPKYFISAIFASTATYLSITSALNTPMSLGSVSPVLVILGLIIYFLGIFISVWAKKTMGRFWNMAGEFDPKRQKKLLLTGPFKFSRNPIYLGLSLLLCGYVLAIQTPFFLLAIIPTFYYYYAAKKEEKFLEKQFGKEYLVYKKKTPLIL